MNTNAIKKPKSYLFQKILWVLMVTAVGFGIGYIFNSITAFTIGGLIGGSVVFFYKKNK